MPDSSVEVVARLGDEELGRTRAELFRADLARSGITNGRHEFRMIFTRWLPPVSLAELRFVGRLGDVEQALPPLSGANASLADRASDPSVPIVDETAEPLFILGPARSGTSALALALLRTGYYEGHGEGHLLPLLHELLLTIDTYYGSSDGASRRDTRLAATHCAAFQHMVRRGFVQLTRETYKSGRWIDKTPTAAMVRAAPLMRELWPNARFIFCKRRVNEVIASRQRKFPNDTLQNHYLDWVDVMQAWLSVREKLGMRSVEIEQTETARNPAAVSRQLASLLGLPDPAPLRVALSAEHPELTGESPHTTTTLAELRLEIDELTELHQNCDPVMSAYGYRYD